MTIHGCTPTIDRETGTRERSGAGERSGAVGESGTYGWSATAEGSRTVEGSGAGRRRRWLRRHVHAFVTAVVVALAGVLLLRQAGGLGRALGAMTRANPFGLLIAAGFAALTYAAAALALMGASGRRVPLGRTTVVQLAAAFTNRILPAGVGAMATNAAYLERDGASRSEAVTAVGLTSVVSLVLHALLTVGALVLFAGRLHLPAGTALLSRLPSVPVVVTLVVAAGIAGWVARRVLRRRGGRLHRAAASAWRTVRSLHRDPRRVALLVIGTAGVTLSHALAFAAAALACGVALPVGLLVAVFMIGTAVGNAAPTPGGLGTLEAALVAGLTGAGAAAAPALAGVLTFRLVTYWLPVLPGAVAARAVLPRRAGRSTVAPEPAPAIRPAALAAVAA